MHRAERCRETGFSLHSTYSRRVCCRSTRKQVLQDSPVRLVAQGKPRALCEQCLGPGPLALGDHRLWRQSSPHSSCLSTSVATSQCPVEAQ